MTVSGREPIRRAGLRSVVVGKPWVSLVQVVVGQQAVGLGILGVVADDLLGPPLAFFRVSAVEKPACRLELKLDVGGALFRSLSNPASSSFPFRAGPFQNALGSLHQVGQAE